MNMLKDLRNLLDKIPRPCRALFNLTLALAVATVFYVSIGSPPLSPAHQFRRVERANFVGPSTILFNEKLTDYDYDHLIVAETESGILTFPTDETLPSSFNYFKKAGDITVISAPKFLMLWGLDNFPVSLPVFVIDDHPEAVRAELELYITGTLEHRVNGIDRTEVLDQYFYRESTRKDDGIFCFILDLPYIHNLDENGYFLDINHGADGYALDALACTFTNMDYLSSEITITAIVRLYDNGGNLITERELLLDPKLKYWE